MKIAFQTFGCRLNQYETQLLKEMAQDGAYQLATLEEAPDIIIVNACSVTLNAVQQTRNMVRRSRRSSPDATIIVTGCFPDDIHVLLNEADQFVSNQEKFRFFEKYFKSSRNRISSFDNHTRAFVKIQTGCNRFCTYCIVPHLRNRECSRSPQEIHQEIVSLVEHGFSEISITGIHIGRYRFNGLDLAGLLRSLEKIDGLRRIRLSSLNPEEITDPLISAIASSSIICNHLHISLQSADQKILQAMGRTYEISDIRRRIESIQANISDCGIGADIITGFPSETESQFRNTYNFIQDLPFSYLHVFRYSPRKKTLAALLPQKVAEKEKKIRSALLRQLGMVKSRAFRNLFLDRILNVLIESKRDKNTKLMVGFSDNYIRVLIPETKNAEERFHDVLINRVEEFDTFGTICNANTTR